MTRTEAAYKLLTGHIFETGYVFHAGCEFTRSELEKYRQLVNDGYTLWLDGGECPVDGDVMVDVVLRDGYLGSRKAETYIWGYKGHDNDIIAYRVAGASEKKPDADMVNNPPHYQILPGVEVYDIRCALMDKIQGATHAQVSDWDRAVEYLLRMWDKNGIQDAKKARWYLDKLIEKLEK